MIKVENLVKHYAQIKAVDGVSFSVGQGEIFGLLGPNGAGKTTTIRTMMDIIKPDSGAIRLMGQPVSEASKARIGYLPEERGLYKNFKLLECLTYLGALKGMARAQARQRAEKLLARIGLDEYGKRKVKELSKGMTQKAQFLAAIVHDPDLLIMDEPFQGLDPVNTELLRSILLAVALSYIPFTAPVMMLIRLGFGQVPTGQVVISLLLLLAGIAFSLWAGAKVFRASLLMYGKRPGLKDLVRAFKQA